MTQTNTAAITVEEAVATRKTWLHRNVDVATDACEWCVTGQPNAHTCGETRTQGMCSTCYKQMDHNSTTVDDGPHPGYYRCENPQPIR